jgi:3-methyl-2-oxobutanoate hydroxymethyltransferase
VRKYAHLASGIEAAVAEYAADVRNRRFPGQENVYAMRKQAK